MQIRVLTQDKVGKRWQTNEHCFLSWQDFEEWIIQRGKTILIIEVFRLSIWTLPTTPKEGSDDDSDNIHSEGEI